MLEAEQRARLGKNLFRILGGLTAIGGFVSTLLGACSREEPTEPAKEPTVSVIVNPTISAQPNVNVNVNVTQHPGAAQTSPVATGLPQTDLGKGTVKSKTPLSYSGDNQAKVTGNTKPAPSTPPEPKDVPAVTLTRCDGLDAAKFDAWPSECQSAFRAANRESLDAETEILRQRRKQ